MINQYDKAGADKKYLVLANNTYAAIAAEIGPCLLAISNNRQALMFTDNSNNICKTLQDSSGDGVLPDESVLIADSTGKATSITGLGANATAFKFPIPFNLEFGDQTVDGSVRFVVTTTGITIQRRVSSAWYTCQEIS